MYQIPDVVPSPSTLLCSLVAVIAWLTSSHVSMYQIKIVERHNHNVNEANNLLQGNNIDSIVLCIKYLMSRQVHRESFAPFSPIVYEWLELYALDILRQDLLRTWALVWCCKIYLHRVPLENVFLQRARMYQTSCVFFFSSSELWSGPYLLPPGNKKSADEVSFRPIGSEYVTRRRLATEKT